MKVIEGIKSTNVNSVVYDEKSGELKVRFTRKKTSLAQDYEYVYKNVSEEEFQVLVEAESIGKTIRQVIKGKVFDKVAIETVILY